MTTKDLENYIRANTVAIAALVESGELPIDTKDNVVSLTLVDLDKMIALGKLPSRISG
jgi:hypothetical protein